MKRSLLLAPVLAALAAPSALASPLENWPHWRGPTGNSVAPRAAPPLAWSESENVRWKVLVPGRGSASPVVWGDKIFVATAIALTPEGEVAPPDASPARASRGQRGPGERREGRGGGGDRGGAATGPQRFVLLCYDRESGALLWERVAAETTPAEGHHHDHGHASSSPMTDGELVFAHFGSRGIFAWTLDGEPAWSYRDFSPMQTRAGFGEGSSPALHGDTILVPWDHEGDSYLLALDKATGQQKWKTARDEPTSWGTPLVVEREGAAQVVVTGQHHARGYDLATGEEIWRCAGQTDRPVASPVAWEDLVFVGSGHRGAFLGAFRLGATGNLEGTEGVAWSVDRNTPDVPSPALSEGRLYYLAGRESAVTCRDALTGEAHYERERIEGMGQAYASPVAAGGHLYVFSRDGAAAVIKDSAEFSVVAVNRLDEGIDATPAFAGGDIIIRGASHLYRIAVRK